MIEIFAVMMLADRNAKKAAERGSEPGPYRTVTYVLWFICEIVGFLAGVLITGDIVGAYFLALLTACAGGLISYIAAMNCTPVSYSQIKYPTPEGEVPLDVPCALTVARLSFPAGAEAVYSVRLNGQLIGDLRDGERMNAAAKLALNIITAHDMSGNEIKPLYFSVPSGGSAWISFNTQRFLPENSGGITVTGDAAAELMMQNQNTQQYPDTGSSAPSQPDSGEDILSSSPMRAVWLLAAVNIFVLTGSVFFALRRGADYSMSGFVTIFFSAVIGICIYLFQHDELKYKLYAAGGLIVSSLIRAFSYQIMLSVLHRPDADISQYSQYYAIIRNSLSQHLSEALVMSLIAAVSALFVCSVHKGSIKKKTLAAAAVCCVLSVICSIFRIVMPPYNIYPPYPYSLTSQIVQTIGGGAAIAAFAAAAYLLGSFGNKRLEVRGSSKIWCIFCAAASFICLACNISDQYYFSVSLMILQTAAIAGYILMTEQKRIGYPVVLCSSLLSVSMTERIFMSFRISSAAACLELMTVINPLICWMLIRNEWYEADSPYLQNTLNSFPQFSQSQPPQTAARSRYDGFYAFCAVINSVSGSIFFLVTILTFTFIQNWSAVPFFLGFLGAFLLALAFLVFRHCFSRTFRLHKAVLVIQALAAGAMTLFLVVFFTNIF